MEVDTHGRQHRLLYPTRPPLTKGRRFFPFTHSPIHPFTDSPIHRFPGLYRHEVVELVRIPADHASNNRAISLRAAAKSASRSPVFGRSTRPGMIPR